MMRLRFTFKQLCFFFYIHQFRPGLKRFKCINAIFDSHYSGFFETELDSVLRSRGISNLVAVGFDSRICLSATLTDAMYRGYRVVALRDAIGTTEYPDTAQGGWASLLAERYLESNVGYTATTEVFISACSSVASP